MSIVIPVLQTVSAFLSRSKAAISQETGVASDIVDRVINEANHYLQKDERIAERIYKDMQSAREHDIQTFDKTDMLSNRLRSTVRPICTFSCLGWYIFARVHDIPLKPEDYAIVGGVLAFWFGFRPFEKGSKG